MGFFASMEYLVSPIMILTYTVAMIFCQVLLALILWSDQMISDQQ